MNTAILLLSATIISYLMQGKVNELGRPHTPAKTLLELVQTALLCMPLNVLVAAGITLLEGMWNQSRFHRDS